MNTQNNQLMTRYHNDLNQVQLPLTKAGLDVFFAICAKVKNQKDIILSFAEIRELSDFTSCSSEVFFLCLDDD